MRFMNGYSLLTSLFGNTPEYFAQTSEITSIKSSTRSWLLLLLLDWTRCVYSYKTSLSLLILSGLILATNLRAVPVWR